MQWFRSKTFTQINSYSRLSFSVLIISIRYKNHLSLSFIHIFVTASSGLPSDPSNSPWSFLPPAFPTGCWKVMFSQVSVYYRGEGVPWGTPPGQDGGTLGYPPDRTGYPLPRNGVPPAWTRLSLQQGLGYPPAMSGWGCPPGRVRMGVPPSQDWGTTLQDRTAEWALAMQQAVCLLRSCRRTFLC